MPCGGAHVVEDGQHPGLTVGVGKLGRGAEGVVEVLHAPGEAPPAVGEALLRDVLEAGGIRHRPHLRGGDAASDAADDDAAEERGIGPRERNAQNFEEKTLVNEILNLKILTSVLDRILIHSRISEK